MNAFVAFVVFALAMMASACSPKHFIFEKTKCTTLEVYGTPIEDRWDCKE
jgi:hypothetical protein